MSLWTLGVAPLVFIVAAWIHECLHIAAVWVVDGEVLAADFWNLHVDFRVDAAWEQRLVLLAPGIVGLASLPALLSAWSGEWSLEAVVIAVAWGIVTLRGGTEGELGLSRHQQPA